MRYQVSTGVMTTFVQKYYKLLILAVAGLFATTSLMMSLTARAAETEFVVSGNTYTAYDEAGTWWFNRDDTTSTPYVFNEDTSTVGDGALYVPPIQNNYSGGGVMGDCTGTGCDKFIGEFFAHVPVGDLDSFSYDYQVGSSGDPTSDSNEFYLNVYANFSGETGYGNCVYNVVPTDNVAGWHTVTFDPTQAYPVRQRSSTPIGKSCPPVPNNIGAGGEFRMFALNLGDTSSNDQYVDGYFDNVRVDVAGNVTVYDFEAPPVMLINKEECMNGGWATSELPVFDNQGQCVSHFASQGKSTDARNKNR